MADWMTISALASAGGTLVLAGVTVGSVRSANRAARVADTEGSQRMSIDVLYGDFEGGQRAISRFLLTPREDKWYASVGRHWNVDRPQPRER